ncbi:MAG: hypothetical protein ACP59X_14340 [Solidesulfovibrio sp. DCME]|uniref:hypothetical protein n=1 Tax=Solidesulfovibrio sp. DCME TaxID=3447380 RepID=UPI003D0F26BB
MSQVVTKVPLSLSTNGRRISVTATAAPSSPNVHVVSATVGVKEDIYLDVVNLGETTTVYVGWGGKSASDIITKANLPANTVANGAVPLHRGILIGAATPLGIYVWVASGGSVTIGGDVLQGVDQ